MSAPRCPECGLDLQRPAKKAKGSWDCLSCGVRYFVCDCGLRGCRRVPVQKKRIGKATVAA